jgi:hypothetical protein
VRIEILPEARAADVDLLARKLVFTPKFLDITAASVSAFRSQSITAWKLMSSGFAQSSTVAEILRGSVVESARQIRVSYR